MCGFNDWLRLCLRFRGVFCVNWAWGLYVLVLVCLLLFWVCLLGLSVVLARLNVCDSVYGNFIRLVLCCYAMLVWGGLFVGVLAGFLVKCLSYGL